MELHHYPELRNFVQVISLQFLNKGLKNVVEAKQFIVDAMPCHPFSYRGDIPDIEPDGFWRQPVFSAVVGFEGKLAKDADFFRGVLDKWQNDYAKYNMPNYAPTSGYVMPTFFGSLRSRFIVSDGFRRLAYNVYPSVANGKNLALQALLASFFDFIGIKHGERPLFAFPPLLTHTGRFTISAPSSNPPAESQP